MKIQNINKKSIILFLYIFGLLHWIFFVNYGNSQLNFFDWPITKNMYLLIERALLEKKIPFFVSLFGQNLFNEKFFANGLYSISPQIFFIKFLGLK